MTGDSKYKNKYAALTAEYESNASNENKSLFAVEALAQGISHVSNDLTEKTQLSRIRTVSCEMITESSSKPAEAIPYLEEILFSRFDVNENLHVLKLSAAIPLMKLLLL